MWKGERGGGSDLGTVGRINPTAGDESSLQDRHGEMLLSIYALDSQGMASIAGLTRSVEQREWMLRVLAFPPYPLWSWPLEVPKPKKSQDSGRTRWLWHGEFLQKFMQALPYP